MPNFPIIDTHVHLYDPSWLRYSWLDRRPRLNKPYGLAEFDAARGAVQVDGIVFAEVWVDPGLHFAEARWVQDLADRDPRLKGIIAHAPVENGAAVEADLERLATNRCLKGIRRLIEIETDCAMCMAPEFVEGVRRVGAHGLSFDICVKHWALPYAVLLAKTCPDVQFVLDHIGKPGIRHGLVEPWKSQLRELSRLPNVTCKMSGVVTEADHEHWRPAELRPYLEHVIDCFGFDRVMYGSDWTVSELTHRYPDWVAILDELLTGSSDSEQRQFWRDNGQRIYRL